MLRPGFEPGSYDSVIHNLFSEIIVLLLSVFFSFFSDDATVHQ